MDESTSLLLQRVAILRSQIRTERASPTSDSIDHLLNDLEHSIESASADSLDLARKNAQLTRQVQDLVQANSQATRQKEALERQRDNLERQLKTLERHNTNLLRQNSQIERHNAALDEGRHARETEKRFYQNLFKTAPDAFLITDASGDIIEANQAAALMLNTGEAELKGANLLNHIATPHKKLFITLLTRLQRIQDIELCVQPRGLPGVDTSLTLSTITDATGKPVLLHWMLRDITERRAAVAALNASERRFRTIFDEATTGILLLDREGAVVRANRALQETLGFSEEELTGRAIAEITSADDPNIANTWLSFNGEGLAPGRLHMLEIRFRRRDGQYVWTSVSLSGLRGEGSRPAYLLAMVKDISAEKQAAADLAEMRRRLVDSGEVDRLRLAQELHDGPTQDLYAAAFRASNFSDQSGDPLLQENLKELQEMLKGVANKLRDIVGELRPPTIANLGLERAIRSHAARVQEQHPELEIKLRLAADGKTLAPHTRLALFRIYQQCISNILRHAEASQVIVSLQLEQESPARAGQAGRCAIKLDIWDNGRGFQKPEKMVDLMRDGHYGLAGIAERAQALGGALTIETGTGTGTLVRVTAEEEG